MRSGFDNAKMGNTTVGPSPVADLRLPVSGCSPPDQHLPAVRFARAVVPPAYLSEDRLLVERSLRPEPVAVVSRSPFRSAAA